MTTITSQFLTDHSEIHAWLKTNADIAGTYDIHEDSSVTINGHFELKLYTTFARTGTHLPVQFRHCTGRFHFGRCEALTTVAGIPASGGSLYLLHLPNVTTLDLELHYASIGMRQVGVTDLAPLRGTCSEFEVTHAPNLIHFQTPNITYHKLTLEHTPVTTLDLPAVLIEMKLGWLTKLKQVSRTASACQTVYIQDCQQLASLAGLTDVETLHISECKALRTINGPVNYSVLNLSTCATLSEIAPIPESVQILSIQNCPEILPWPPLPAGLTQLFLSGQPNWPKPSLSQMLALLQHKVNIVALPSVKWAKILKRHRDTGDLLTAYAEISKLYPGWKPVAPENAPETPAL